ncbi:electron transfer flavoprotein subunit alpha/FixB family protein [Methylorubrum extorquens]|uniref:electron transfer flavoprotein subunit alpha/FixB family protein n=1 Tax=Methylorubrum extorquens TaxID=408 RepID=UPI000158F88D|nr:electron transfer flavoprotein subunit alpha/FixB family protein [Methylorubrum extorquens]ABY32118.1 Electron transfer flavoprotein alpha subunit [Methylorubrum extorquens PA1]KQP95244.1 electron transfer flavoprotein subunit alpha [Methylobacterium sp. Leaf119]WIU38726.1 electron transfer flavoprotein subunit alpha/FixB family protein [Methylorubrum extorquens]
MSRPRRDPRAERAASLVVGEGPRYDRTRRATASGRPRRDPRAERAAQRIGDGARARYDLSQIGRTVGEAVTATPRAAPAAEAPKTIIFETPAFLVAVVPDAPGGRLSGHDRQVIGAARALAGREGAVAVIVEGECEGLGAAGADRMLRLERAEGYDPGARAARIEAALAGVGARHVLFPESLDGGDLARRVAVGLNEALFTNAEVVAAKGLVRPARGRRVEQSLAPPRLATVAPDAVADYAGPPREARALPFEGFALEIPKSIVSATRIPADPATVPLSLAEFVVSAGNGLSDLDTFRQVVSALHATPGASRVLCDAGLMPRHTQVGASGTVLAATCYFALGISGAPQHLQGVAGCEHVVAVNTDLHAAMIERAGLAVVQDAQAVMPALLRLLAEEAAGSGTAS